MERVDLKSRYVFYGVFQSMHRTYCCVDAWKCQNKLNGLTQWRRPTTLALWKSTRTESAESNVASASVEVRKRYDGLMIVVTTGN